jgi:hypothetical protein
MDILHQVHSIGREFEENSISGSILKAGSLDGI